MAISSTGVGAWQALQQTPETPEPATGGLTFGEGTTVIVTTSEPSYSSERKEDYEAAQEMLVAVYGASASAVGAYINAYAARFQASNGRWPSAGELFAQQDYHLGASRVASGASALPQYFWTVGEDGTRRLWDNSSSIGPIPVPVDDLLGGKGFWPLSPSMVDPEQAEGYLQPYQFVGEKLFGPSVTGGLGYGTGATIPTFTEEMFNQALNITPPTSPSPPGGARGPVYDRNLVIENITAMWRNRLMEEPDQPGALADRYINEARSFARQGGSLNLETWVSNQMRKTSRYNILYRRKPESLSEDDYINQYRGTVNQFGFNQRTAQEFIESGLESGAGAAGFTERVATSRPGMLSQQGAWSQRFAQSVASLGALGVND